MTAPYAGVDADAARTVADAHRVCTRPLLRTVTDTLTGDEATIPIACGSTRDHVCGPCADKARRLRMQQCRDGWHRTTEPDPPTPAEDEADPDSPADQDAEDAHDAGDEDDGSGTGSGRRVRSTRRVEGFPDLPAVPMRPDTIGRVFEDPTTGRPYRPSMFLTLTLPSYGRVIPGTGIPADPTRYDYHRAALDALTFPRLLDRFWQNLRRCAGYKVQYFSAIEAQRRLAPHLHAALRGAIPRATLKAVARATYYAAWWPALDRPRYQRDQPTSWPVWDAAFEAYLDPSTGEILTPWDDAVADLDQPAHIAAFGTQIDIKGLLGDTPDSDRAVRYLCKYLTKAIATTYTGTDPTVPADPAYAAHIDRLHDHTRWLPCGPACANWLLHAVQPAGAGPGLIPGRCASPAHDRENLGLGGRRVLVSRQWSGKTLTEHRADRRAVVTAVLTAAGLDPLDADRLAADHTLPDGRPRYIWTDVPVGERDYVATIAASLRQARTWRDQYEHAKTIAAQRGSPPDDPVDSHSASDPAA